MAFTSHRHPEGEARRIPYQLAEGFFTDAQNDNKGVILGAKPEGSRAKKVRDSSLTLRMTIKKSKLKAQSSKLQLKTLKLSSCHPEGSLSCHPERSEGSHAQQVRDSSLSLRMTMKNSKLKTQNSKLQLKTLKLTFGHPERSLLSAAGSLFRNLI